MPDRRGIRTELDFLSELEGKAARSQLALAKQLSVSVGLVNALLKRSVRKGLAKAGAVPPRRWVYYLTPRGLSEKSRLVALYLESSLEFFREAREQYSAIFVMARAGGAQEIALVGKGELVEIALLAAREAGISVKGVVDPQANVEHVYGLPVLRKFHDIGSNTVLVLTESRRPQAVYDEASAACEAEILAPDFLRISRLETTSPAPAEPVT